MKKTVQYLRTIVFRKYKIINFMNKFSNMNDIFLKITTEIVTP